MDALGKILVPVDFEAPSDGAIRLAADLARRLGSSLTLVHVYDARGYAMMSGYVAYTRDELKALTLACRQRLDEALDEAESLGIENVETRLLEGLAAPTIVELATVGAFDLIVMASHGKTSPWQRSIGVVAEDVLGEAPCPVIIVNREPARPRDVVSEALDSSAHCYSHRRAGDAARREALARRAGSDERTRDSGGHP